MVLLFSRWSMLVPAHVGFIRLVIHRVSNYLTISVVLCQYIITISLGIIG